MTSDLCVPLVQLLLVQRDLLTGLVQICSGGADVGADVGATQYLTGLQLSEDQERHDIREIK